MVQRDTRTGGVMEQMVLPALRQGGYTWRPQANIGNRFGGGRHMVDLGVSDRNGSAFLVSLKWQQVSGTAEQKVPFEAMCLAEAVLTDENDYDKAYIVLGGTGWKLRDFFVNGGLAKHMRHGDLVHITTLEQFVALANKGTL